MTPRERMLVVWREFTERRVVLGGGLGVLAGAAIALILILSAGGGHHHVTTASTVSAPVPTTPAPPVPVRSAAQKRPRRQLARRARTHPGKRGRASTTGRATATPPVIATSHTTATTRASSTTTAASSTGTVLLILHGGGNATLSTCGQTHHYRTYAAGSPIAFSGTVRPVPAGRWKVKLRIKVCRGQTFTDLAKIAARRGPSGSFSGSFNAPGKGEYTARAVLYVTGKPLADSTKRHFATH